MLTFCAVFAVLFPASCRRAWIAHDLRYLGNDNDAVWIRPTRRFLNSKFRSASSRGCRTSAPASFSAKVDLPTRRRAETHTVSLARCVYSSHIFGHSSTAAASPALHIETQGTPSGASHAPCTSPHPGPRWVRMRVLLSSRTQATTTIAGFAKLVTARADRACASRAQRA